MKIAGVVVLLMATGVFAARMTTQQQMGQFTPQDFSFDMQSTNGQGDLGCTMYPGSAQQMPVLDLMGMSTILIVFEPCGLFLPHTHPRATELGYVIDGELEVGLAEEDGGRTFVNNITGGVIAVFPQGYLHYMFNDNCQPAKYVAGFNSADPGILTFPDRLYSFNNQVLIGSLGVNNNQVNYLREAAEYRDVRTKCQRRCGIRD